MEIFETLGVAAYEYRDVVNSILDRIKQYVREHQLEDFEFECKGKMPIDVRIKVKFNEKYNVCKSFYAIDTNLITGGKRYRDIELKLKEFDTRYIRKSLYYEIHPLRLSEATVP